MWERWRPSASSASSGVPRTYGPTRSPQRAHSAPAEARTSPSVQWHTPADMEALLRGAPSHTPPAATPAWLAWSSDHHTAQEPASLGEAITMPPVGGGTTPVEPRGISATLTMADIQRALYNGPQVGPAGPGFTTPLQPEPIQHVGLPTHTDYPPEQRRGEPRLSDSMLQSLLRSCTMSNSMRRATPNIFRPHYMRNVLPVSSLGARGAAPSAHSLPNTVPFPVDPVQRVSEAIRLAADARARTRGQQQQVRQQMASQQAVPMSPSTPSPPRAGDTATSSQSYEVVPHMYEGNDRACSLCQEEFEHGQEVCRLTCRHMFHAACWETYVSHSVDEEYMSCPNCRGPGTDDCRVAVH